MGPFKTMAAIRAAHGGHFFDPSSMRFFDSRIESREPINGRYFVTSEKFHGSSDSSGPRLFTLRVVSDDGDISTVGDFQAYVSHAAAKRAVPAEED